MAKSDAKANDRGELSLPLDGQTYHLRPSYKARVAFEEQTGKSLHELTVAAQQGRLTLSEMGIIAAEMMKAYARSHPDCELHTDHAGAKPERLEELIHEAGSARIEPRLLVALLAALTGGVDASGEWKPAKGSLQPSAG